MALTPEQKNILAEVTGRWPLFNNGTQLQCGYCSRVVIDSVVFQAVTLATKVTMHYLDCPEYSRMMAEAVKLAAARKGRN